MLRRLRIQLTVLYILAALGLAAMLSAGAYLLLNYYFQKQTDLALSYKMATTFKQYGLPLPPELLQAEQNYLGREGLPVSPPAGSPVLAINGAGQGEEEERESTVQTPAKTDHETEMEDRYDARLAPIYVLESDAQGNVLASPTVANISFKVNQEARQAALLHGYDLRTVRSQTGELTRLLTYRVDHQGDRVILQVGRSLADQERLRYEFLLGLIGLGAIGAILLGLGSWWLSGQTLIPAQRSWDQQLTFISNASHELRTPLTLIRASTEVIKRSQPVPDTEQSLLIADILAECDYMDHLVADLLLLSRLDTRRLQLARQPVSLPGLLEETALQARKLLGGKQIAIQVGPAQGIVWADPDRLRQVLLILLENAICYTPDGGLIRLEAWPRHKYCQVIVSDNGAGISPTHLPYIFDRFYQANPTGEGSARSNGLGLSIARGIILASGGKIYLESQLGQGTRAILELPGVE